VHIFGTSDLAKKPSDSVIERLVTLKFKFYYFFFGFYDEIRSPSESFRLPGFFLILPTKRLSMIVYFFSFSCERF
jgi:hypothetical protein